jgi:hypothetical protein
VVEHIRLGDGKPQGAVGGGRGLAGPEHAGEWQPYLAEADTVIAAAEDIGGPQLAEDRMQEDTGGDRCVSDRRINCRDKSRWR